MKVEVLETNPKDFRVLRDKRGIWAIKQYLHRWYEYQGREVFSKYRRKHNRDYIEVAHHQHLVDEMKPLFALTKIGTRVLHDEKEGYGVMQEWHDCLGTVKHKDLQPYYMTDRGLFEILKICIFDGVIGGLDRHGNNVLVLRDHRLLTIDDEDVFYDKLRIWVKFDGNIKQRAYMNYLRHRPEFDAYVKHLKKNVPQLLEIADHPVMKNNKEYPFYKIFAANCKRIDDIAAETVRQLLL